MTTIEELKDDVTIVEVLQWFGGSFGRGSFGAEWRPMNCPFCKDNNGSASLSVSAGRFICHQCGAPRDGKSGDIIDVVAYAENLTPKEAIAWIDRTLRR